MVKSVLIKIRMKSTEDLVVHKKTLTVIKEGNTTALVLDGVEIEYKDLTEKYAQLITDLLRQVAT
jgi:ribosome recycling factor